MAFTPSLIGSATGNNVASLSIIVPAGGVAAGGQIWVAYAGSSPLDDVPTDSAGNKYEPVAGGGSGGTIAAACLVSNCLALAHNNTILLTPAFPPFSGRAAAFSVSGLSSGLLVASSAGQGNSTLPDAALNNVPVGNWMVGIAGVGGPSTDGFTQATGWSTPSSLNTQATTNFSAYAGFKQSAGGQIVFNPILGVSRNWVALLLSIQP